MKYHHYEVEFEIPDEWLIKAGVSTFTPCQSGYEAEANGTQEIIFIDFYEIAPLVERAAKRGVFCDSESTGESAKQRVMRILNWLREGHPIEPVKVVPLENSKFKYKLVEGSHRFHCAFALGFKVVPAVYGFDLGPRNA